MASTHNNMRYLFLSHYSPHYLLIFVSIIFLSASTILFICLTVMIILQCLAHRYLSAFLLLRVDVQMFEQEQSAKVVENIETDAKSFPMPINYNINRYCYYYRSILISFSFEAYFRQHQMIALIIYKSPQNTFSIKFLKPYKLLKIMNPEKSSSAPKIKEKVKVSKQFDKFAKTVAKMKKEGKWFDLFEAVLKQSRIVYIDPEKKYVIAQTSFLETASKKVGAYKDRVQELEKNQHERNARIKELELEVARMKRQENQQMQLKSKNQKKMKRKMKQIQQKLNKQQQQILSLSEKLQSHNKIELLKFQQETKNKNIQINKRSIQCQTLYCDLNIPETSPFTYSKCATIHVEPAKQCFRSCKQIYMNNIQSLIQSLKKLSLDLEPKLQNLTDINGLIQKYQRRIGDIESQNKKLQNDIEKMRSYEAVQRKKIWSRCIKTMINEIRGEWEKIGEPLNKEGVWKQAKSNDSKKSLGGVRSNEEQSKQQ